MRTRGQFKSKLMRLAGSKGKRAGQICAIALRPSWVAVFGFDEHFRRMKPRKMLDDVLNLRLTFRRERAVLKHAVVNVAPRDEMRDAEDRDLRRGRANGQRRSKQC